MASVTVTFVQHQFLKTSISFDKIFFELNFFRTDSKPTYQSDIIILNSNINATKKMKTILMGFDTIEIKLINNMVHVMPYAIVFCLFPSNNFCNLPL